MKDPVEPFVEKTSAIADGLKDIGVLSPDRTPNHLIATCALASLTLINATGDYTDKFERFVVVTGFLTLIALLSIWLISHTAPLDDMRYRRSLRLSRTLGLVSGCFAFVVSWHVMQEEPSHFFYWLLAASLVQCGIFGYYVYSAQKRLEKGEELKIADIPSRIRAINNQQLCIVTAALMMGMSFNANIAIDKTDEEVVSYDSTATNRAQEALLLLEQAGGTVSGLAAHIEEGLASPYGQLPPPAAILDSLKRISFTIEGASPSAYRYETESQHLIVTWIFRLLWLIVITIWSYQILPGVRFFFVSPKQPSANRTGTMALEE